MKKKILAVVTASILTLGCFASVSASAESKAEKLIADGVVNVSGVSVSEEEGFEAIALSENAMAAVAHLIAQYPNDKAVKVFEVEGDSENEELVTLTIADEKIKVDKKYSLKVMNLNTGEWSTSGISVVSIKAGLAKFKITKAGAYALVQAKEAAEVPSQPVVVVSNKKAAPKTGEQ